jgi:hypothetical protein
VSDGALELVVEDSPPRWRYSPWRVAIEFLSRGKVELFLELVLRGEPVPTELQSVLKTAFNGGGGLPFRFDLIGNSTPGKKKAGRWQEMHFFRDIALAVQVMTRRQQGMTYEAACREVADCYATSDGTVRGAYTKYGYLAPWWIEWATELETGLRGLSWQDSPQAKPVIVTPEGIYRDDAVAVWMLKGDSDLVD